MAIEIDPKQWHDPSLMLVGNGNPEWARWATAYLYENVANANKSEDWPKTGIIQAFDRRAIAVCPDATPVDVDFPTNNRNWLLLARVACARDNEGNEIPLSQFDVSISVPPTTFLMESQPASLQFGSGEWPHILFYPESWSANVLRTITVINRSGIAATLVLGFKFLQVRTN